MPRVHRTEYLEVSDGMFWAIKIVDGCLVVGCVGFDANRTIDDEMGMQD